MRGLAVALLLTAIVVAGCADKGASTSTTSAATSNASGTASTTHASTSGSATGQGPGSSTTTTTSSSAGSAAQDHAPVAQLSLNRTSGAGPLSVSAAVNGTDTDGDALTYVLTFGDGSANVTGSLPATAQAHTFTLQGNFTVTLVVSDATTSSNASAVVAVLGSSGGIPPPAVFKGTATGACEPSNQVGTCTTPDILQKFTVTPAVQTLEIKLTWDIPSADLDLYINDATATQRGKSADTNGPADDPSPVGIFSGPHEQTTIEGLVPADAGEWVAKIRPYSAPNVTYTLTITYK
jgi:PKD repeat protein